MVEAVTDENGAFRAEGVAPGALMARLDRGDSRSSLVRSIGPAREEVEIVLGSPTEIRGRLIDARSRAPIRAFRVSGSEARLLCASFLEERGPVSIEIRGDSFRVSILPPVWHSVRFEAPGYHPASVEIRGRRAESVKGVLLPLRRAENAGRR